MKLLLFVAVPIFFFLAIRSFKTNSLKSDKASRFGFFTSISILMLRLVRGALALAFVLVGLFACRVLSKEFMLIGAAGGRQDSFDFWGSIGFLFVFLGFFTVLYLIYRVSGRLCTQINQLHIARDSSHFPLIKTHWSL